MKKIVFALFLILSLSAIALPYWNPWVRTWEITIGEQTYVLRFNEEGQVKNLKTGQVFDYDYDGEILYLFNFYGQDYTILVHFTEDQCVFEGVETVMGLSVKGNTFN